jgi:hypothetical protein
MKRILIAAAIAASFATPAVAADVGVSVSVGQPGFYGRIDIGGFPPPRVIYAQPRVVQPVVVEREPIYLRVPPGHARHWRKYCGQYNACGERVYFVQDDWYNREYAPRYREQHGNRGDEHREQHGDDRGEQHGNKHDEGNDHDRGRH